MLLPEVPEAEGESAARATDVTEPGGPPAAAGTDPAVSLLGALAQSEAVGGELGKCVVAPLGDVLEPGGDPLVPGGGVGQLLARVLGLLHGDAGVAAQTGDALDGLAQQTAALTADANVPVVGLVAHRHGEADTEAADEVAARLAGLLGAVVGDGVHHAERVGARVEVEADRERQPTAVTLTVLAVDLDDRADGARLLDGDLGDGPLEALGPDRALVLVLDLGLADQHEPPVLGDLRRPAGDRLDERGARLADLGGDDPGGDGDRAAALVDGDLLVGYGGVTGAQRQLAVARTDRVGRPLERAVGPVGDRPGLDRHGLAVGVRDRELLALLVDALGPGDTDGGTGCGTEAAVLQPVQGHGGVVGLGGSRRGLRVLGSQRPAELRGGTGDGGGFEDGPAGDGGHGHSFPWTGWSGA